MPIISERGFGILGISPLAQKKEKGGPLLEGISPASIYTWD